MDTDADCAVNHPNPQTMLDENREADVKTVALGQVVPGTGFQLGNLHDIWYEWHSHTFGLRKLRYIELETISRPRQVEISFTARDIKRWKMAWRAVQVCRERLRDSQLVHNRYNNMPFPKYLFRQHQDWPSIDDIVEKPVALGFSVAGFIYGGLHALAWSAHFQSSIEQLLWRISACIVIGGFPTFILLILILDLIDKTRPQSLLKKRILDFSYGVVFIQMLIVLVAYMLARAYLVIGSFINLSQLPAGVYDMPNWSAYFPHIV